MFLPLLDASTVMNGQALLGARIELYSSADWIFTYIVNAVRRHVTPSGTTRLRAALASTTPELWLQTSEGPSTASTYLQVVASLANARPSDHAAANPAPRPTICM
jgi:hypothetical protein